MTVWESNFSGEERKNWQKKNWKTDVYAQNEIHWFPSLSAVRKSNFLEYSSLELFYVTVLDQKREKVKHRMVFFICSSNNNLVKPGESQDTVRGKQKLRDNEYLNFTHFYKKKKHADKT